MPINITDVHEVVYSRFQVKPVSASIHYSIIFTIKKPTG